MRHPCGEVGLNASKCIGLPLPQWQWVSFSPMGQQSQVTFEWVNALPTPSLMEQILSLLSWRPFSQEQWIRSPLKTAPWTCLHKWTQWKKRATSCNNCPQGLQNIATTSMPLQLMWQQLLSLFECHNHQWLMQFHHCWGHLDWWLSLMKASLFSELIVFWMTSDHKTNVERQTLWILEFLLRTKFKPSEVVIEVIKTSKRWTHWKQWHRNHCISLFVCELSWSAILSQWWTMGQQTMWWCFSCTDALRRDHKHETMKKSMSVQLAVMMIFNALTKQSALGDVMSESPAKFIGYVMCGSCKNEKMFVFCVHMPRLQYVCVTLEPTRTQKWIIKQMNECVTVLVVGCCMCCSCTGTRYSVDVAGSSNL